MALVFHPTQPNTALVGTGAGVFRTTDNGLNWERTLADTIFAVSDIVFDPTSGNRVFVVNQSLSRSVDGGLSFTLLPLPVPNELVAAAAFSPNGVMYTATYSGRMLKSTDSATTWSELTVPWPMSTNARYTVAPDPNNSSIVYVVTPGAGTFKSIDAGATWTPLPGSPGNGPAALAWNLAIKPGNSNVLLASTPDGIARSTDGGTTWSVLLAGTFPSWVAFDPLAPDNVLAVTFSGQVMRSNDSGATWPANLLGPKLRANNSVHLTFHPTIAGRVFLDSSDGPMYSANGGQSFVLRTGGIHAGRVLRFSAADDGTVYAGFVFPAGVFKRAPDWQPVNNAALFVSPFAALNLNGIAVQAHNSQVLYASDFEGRVLRSVDSGATWGPPSASYAQQLVGDLAADPDNPDIAYVASQSGALRTTNGGITWQPGAGIEPFVQRVVVSLSNPQVLYAATIGVPKRIYRSADRGLNWTPAASLPDGEIGALNVDPLDSQVVFTVVGLHLLKSANGGQSWTEIPVHDSAGVAYNIGSDVLVDPTARNTLIVMSNAQHRGFVRSVDGGVTWQRTERDIGGNISYATAGILHPRQPNLLIAGFEGLGVAEYTIATDLEATITPPAFPFATGGAGTMTVSVRNVGPHAASSAQLRVTLPSWLTTVSTADCVFGAPILTCNLAALQVGQTTSLAVVVTANATASSGQLRAEVTGHETDQAAANDVATIAIESAIHSELGLSGTADDGAFAGNTISKTLTVINHGPGDSEITTVTANVTNNLVIATATPSRGTCTTTATSVTCQLGGLAAGASATIALTATASTTGVAELAASVTGSHVDTIAGNNAATLRTTVTTAPAPPKSGGGGGGRFDWLGIALLGLLLARRRLVPGERYGN